VSDAHALRTSTEEPSETDLSSSADAEKDPRILDGLYPLGFFPLLTGVGPKNTAIASPSSENATSPTSMAAQPFPSFSEWNGASKYISSPQRRMTDLNGRTPRRALTEQVSSSLRATAICKPFPKFIDILDKGSSKLPITCS